MLTHDVLNKQGRSNWGSREVAGIIGREVANDAGLDLRVNQTLLREIRIYPNMKIRRVFLQILYFNPLGFILHPIDSHKGFIYRQPTAQKAFNSDAEGNTFYRLLIYTYIPTWLCLAPFCAEPVFEGELGSTRPRES